MPATQKKAGSSKPKGNVPSEPVDDTPKVDWDKLDPAEIPPVTRELWYNAACEAIQKDSLDAFKVVLKTVIPVSSLVSLFQLHRNDVADIDIIKIAVVHGCKPIVLSMLTVLGEAKFYEFARWNMYSAVHVAAMWGHVELVECKLINQPMHRSINRSITPFITFIINQSIDRIIELLK